jgi:hypothetical protein
MILVIFLASKTHPKVLRIGDDVAKSARGAAAAVMAPRQANSQRRRGEGAHEHICHFGGEELTGVSLKNLLSHN